VPLSCGDRRNVYERPLACFVFHRRLYELNLQSIIGVADDSADLSRPTRIYLTIYPFEEIESAPKEFPPPAFVADAMIPEGLARERRVGQFGIPDEALGCVGV